MKYKHMSTEARIVNERDRQAKRRIKRRAKFKRKRRAHASGY